MDDSAEKADAGLTDDNTMLLYIGIGVAVVIVIGIALMSMGKDNSQKVNLDDLDDPDAKPRKRAKLTRPDGASVSSSSEGVSNQIDRDALYKELDQSGPFPKTLAGSLEPEAFVQLKGIIGKYAYLAFIPRKEEMMEERLGFLKAKKMKEYSQTVQKAAVEYQKIQIEATKIAAEYIELDEANFEASIKQAMADPKLLQQMKQDEENVRTRAEPQRDNLTKEKAKQIMIERTKMEFEAERKVQNTKGITSQQQAQGMLMFERTRVMDELYMKYQVKLSDLQHAVAKFDLENDEEIKTVKNANLAAREQIIKQKQEEIKKSLELNETDANVVKEVIKQAGDINTNAGIDGTIDFDEYLKVFSVMVTCQIRLSSHIEPEIRDKRRQALASGNQQQFGMIGTECLQKIAKCKQGVSLDVLKQMAIAPELFDKTQKTIQTDPQRGQKMKAAAQKAELEERLRLAGPGYEPLEKEDALKHVEGIEMQKIQIMAGAIIAQKMGKIPAEKMGMVQELAKMQALDQYQSTAAVEDRDIVIAFSKYNLSESDEFKAVMTRVQQALQQQVQQHVQQMQQQMMAARGGMPGGMPGMGGMGGMPQQRAPPAPAPQQNNQGPDAADLGW